jgi:hypothetical protein
MRRPVTEEETAGVSVGGCVGIGLDTVAKHFACPPVCLLWIHHQLVVSEEIDPNNWEGDGCEQKCPRKLPPVKRLIQGPFPPAGNRLTGPHCARMDRRE